MILCAHHSYLLSSSHGGWPGRGQPALCQSTEQSLSTRTVSVYRAVVVGPASLDVALLLCKNTCFRYVTFPIISTPAFYSLASLVPIGPLVHFPVLQCGANISNPTSFTPANSASSLLPQTTNRNWYVACWTAPFVGHFRRASVTFTVCIHLLMVWSPLTTSGL